MLGMPVRRSSSYEGFFLKREVIDGQGSIINLIHFLQQVQLVQRSTKDFEKRKKVSGQLSNRPLSPIMCIGSLGLPYELRCLG